MKNYYRVMLGAGSAFAKECFEGNFIGADFDIAQDLTHSLPEDWREFNHEFRPIYLSNHPGKTGVAAGLACGALWTIAKGIRIGDVVLCPDGHSHYRVGEVVGEYSYHPDGILPHRRAVRWLPQTIDRSAMSEALQNSSGWGNTVVTLTNYSDEIERLIGGIAAPSLIANDPSVQDPYEFAMEKHLESFLIANWSNTEFGKDFVIYEVEGEQVGQQYRTDTGPLDILAISKDKKTLLVVELKRGRASDAVVGQTLRYMGYVKDEIAEVGQVVVGAIVALDDDLGLRRAISVAPNISFYRYKVDFKLLKA